MSYRANVQLQLLLWGISAGLTTLPADLAAQAAAHQPPQTLGVWIEEARASPFHGLTVSGTLENPAAELAVDVGAGVGDMVWPLVAPSPELPDSAVSSERVFGYTLLAAFAPMVPAMLMATSYHWDTKSEADGLATLGLTFLGGMVTLVSVPVTAMVVGNTSLLRTIAGTATGFLAGALVGGAFAVFPPEVFWTPPVYSLTMAIVTTAIAVR